MCKICGNSICSEDYPPRGIVSPTDLHPSALECEMCYLTIDYGRKYYDFDGEIICRDCVKSYIQDYAKDHEEVHGRG